MARAAVRVELRVVRAAGGTAGGATGREGCIGGEEGGRGAGDGFDAFGGAVAAGTGDRGSRQILSFSQRTPS